MNKIELIKQEAEGYFARGEFFCSEAIVASIRKHIAPQMPIEMIATASGFPTGIGGSKCVCGAVSGGVIAIGYLFGRTVEKDKAVMKAMALSKELMDYFKTNYQVGCCKVICKGLEYGSAEQGKKCIVITGMVAEKTAEIIMRELKQ